MEKKPYIQSTFANLAAAKQARILDAAVDEFSRWGYEKASINRMVGRLAIAKGSIFSTSAAKEISTCTFSSMQWASCDRVSNR